MMTSVAQPPSRVPRYEYRSERHAVTRIRESMAGSPWCGVLTSCPIDQDWLLDLGSALGSPCYDVVNNAYVKTMEGRKGALSTPDPEAELHTDGAQWPSVNDLTLLQCVRPDQAVAAGISIIVAWTWIDLAKLVPYALDGELLLPFRLGPHWGEKIIVAPAIQWHAAGVVGRYSRRALEEGATVSAEHHLSKATVTECIEQLRNAISLAPRLETRLEAGELFVLNNRRCLHGRTNLSGSQSERLVRRIKVNMAEPL